MRRALLSVVLAAATLLVGCSETPVACRVGADCASGVCEADGRCAAPAPDDGGAAGGGGGTSALGGGAGGGDATGGGTPDAGPVDAGTPVGCQPNHDGVIERGEVYFAPGLRATYLVSGAATFDTAGAPESGERRRWDFSGALAGDAARLVETRALAGTWFESEFPNASYYTELDKSTGLLAIFGVTAEGLFLQGVVSPEDGFSSTRVRYEPAVKVLAFPMRLGDSWTTSTVASGRYSGVLLGYQQETYDSTVDRAGDAVTPYATFDSLRVRTVMHRAINYFPTLTLRTFSWVTECFGTIATVQSEDNETSTDFTRVAEARRLSP